MCWFLKWQTFWQVDLSIWIYWSNLFLSNSLQLTGYFRISGLKYKIRCWMIRLKKVFSIWNHEISMIFFLFIAKRACSRIDRPLVDVISVYETNSIRLYYVKLNSHSFKKYCFRLKCMLYLVSVWDIMPFFIQCVQIW